MKHPIANLISDFDAFLSSIRKEGELGNIDLTESGDLLLADYSRTCQFDAAWTPITEVCRGLILDVKNKKVVGLPMPKFWNLNERGTAFKNLPYVAQEKMDGSMGLIWRYNGKLNLSTRGSFTSPQAIKGKEMLDLKYPNAEVVLHPNVNLVCEIIYPENRIVVDYKGEEKLTLITAYDNETFKELDEDAVDLLAEVIGFDRPKVYKFNSFLELEETVKSWPQNQEGLVVKFSDGSRCKIKSSEYIRAHKLISSFSPLSVWEAVKDGVEMEFIKELPDEFQDQYRVWKSEFESRAEKLWANVVTLYEATKHLSDKELGIASQDKRFGNMSGMIFAIRKNGADLNNKKARNWVFDQFRPKANVFKKFEE